MRWEKIIQDGGGPGKRWGHTCNSVNDGRFIYVFGGYGKDNCQTNQVHVFDTEKHMWSQPLIKGTPPIPRDSHTCTTVGENLFVFGGTDGKIPLGDLHILDTATHTWITPSVRGDGPEAREGHTVTLAGKRLFLFGGSGKSPSTGDEIYYNDVYILNTETFAWKRADITGSPPAARDSHTCSSWKNLLVVIAGEDAHDFYLSDVHILDTDTLMWKELNTSGQLLPPRAGHSTVAFGNILFVFGGFTDAQNLYDDLYMLDVETGIWTKVITTGDGPPCRFSLAGDCVDPLKSGVLVFIGGCNRSLEALDDMYYLHTGLVQDDCKTEKLSMRKQLKLKCQEQSLTSPVRDNTLVSIGSGITMRQPVPGSSFNQSGRENIPLNVAQSLEGKKPFVAKVTEAFPHGYSIETVIDGKSLRGIVFANKPPPFPVGNNNSSRKRTSSESGDVTLNDDCDNKSKSLRISRENSTDNVQQSDGIFTQTTEVTPTPSEPQNQLGVIQDEPTPNPVCMNPTKPEPQNLSDFVHSQPIEATPTPVFLNPTQSEPQNQSDVVHGQIDVTLNPLCMNPAVSEPQNDPDNANLPEAPLSLNDEKLNDGPNRNISTSDETRMMEDTTGTLYPNQGKQIMKIEMQRIVVIGETIQSLTYGVAFEHNREHKPFCTFAVLEVVNQLVLSISQAQISAL
ncbi:hypothetical protein ACFE04_010131 [Oxalis oulophora]